MYLMNVPPIAATHTEWRTCGPPQGYSLPLCFNDSDIDLSSSGTPIPDKVQMIIESLRSTQSSLNMGDEIEGNVLSVQEVHPQVCKVGMDPLVGSKSISKGSPENRQADISLPINSESQDSDSDDSVDRGIEEAILEYLKEKDDHKRKAEPSANALQPSKIHRKNPPISDVSKQHSDSNKVLTASNHFPKSVKVETPIATSVLVTKKNLKNKTPCKENPVKKMDTNKGTTAKNAILSKEQKTGFSKTNMLFNKEKFPVAVKLEEDSPDSSSDDGIEEAIQRYQLEKKEKQDRSWYTSKPLAIKEESDSSSDDGIEEAIRCYQLEQQKERSVLKPFLHKQKPISKTSVNPIESTSTENMQKLKSKKKTTEKEVKSVLPSPSSVLIPKNTVIGSPKGKGNGVLSSKVEPFREQHIPVTPKVNTSAELMCAEAILDISKAVMPGAFNPNIGLSSIQPTHSPSLPPNCQDDRSDDSSIDSEDGIEQEIRKFLEQKAQMHKQSPNSASITTGPGSINELDKVKTKQGAAQKRAFRLSLTQRRKHHLEDHNVSKEAVIDNIKEDVAFKSLPEHGKGSSSSVSSQRGKTPPSDGLERTVEQCGDKSSSLDSDEDLDTAIKDLLKTKRKLKKKTRDMKLKTRKCLKDTEPLLGNWTKKLKPDPISKCGVLKRVHKAGDDMAEKSKLSKKNMSPHKQRNKGKEHIQAGEMDALKGTGGGDTTSLHNSQAVIQIKEDSSSVDSDDSIEQEIRKFLAEKAKVSTTEKNKDGDIPRNGNVDACTQVPVKDIKLEDQLAEIPSKYNTFLPDRTLLSSSESKASQDREAFPTKQIALAENSSATPTVSATGLSSALSNRPGLLEPADGAGASRTEKMRHGIGSTGFRDATLEMVRAQAPMSPSAAQSRSDSIKWLQSLGLPTTETRGVSISRPQFHITTAKISGASTTSPYQRGGINPKPQTYATLWSSARNSKSAAPLCHSPESPVNNLSHYPFYSTFSAPRKPPERSFINGAQDPISGQTESRAHVPKDKSVFVELASNMTNHVQVQSREISQGKEGGDSPSVNKRERESMKTDDEGVQLGRAEEDFVDETDCELDERRSPEKKQRFSTLSLSSAIDPGITLEPYIALTTEERSTRFIRRCMAVKCKENKTVKHVKRKLQFGPMSRIKGRQPVQHS